MAIIFCNINFFSNTYRRYDYCCWFVAISFFNKFTRQLHLFVYIICLCFYFSLTLLSSNHFCYDLVKNSAKSVCNMQQEAYCWTHIYWNISPHEVRTIHLKLKEINKQKPKLRVSTTTEKTFARIIALKQTKQIKLH